jgi:hypothetical protein
VALSLSLSLSLLAFILPIKWGGVFGVGLDVFLFLFWSVQNWFYPSLLAP